MDNMINDRLELECKNLSNNLNMLFRKGYSLIAEPDVNGINVAVRGRYYISGGLVQVSDIKKLPDTAVLHFIRSINEAIEHVNKGESNV